MDVAAALEYFKANSRGTIATIRADGSPHVSLVDAAVVEDRLWISSREDLVKVKNLRRDPRASFIAGTAAWVAVDAAADLLDGRGVLEKLRLYYRTLAGEHPDWDDYDAAMIRDRRLLISLTPLRAYGFGA